MSDHQRCGLFCCLPDKVCKPSMNRCMLHLLWEVARVGQDSLGTDNMLRPSESFFCLPQLSLLQSQLWQQYNISLVWLLVACSFKDRPSQFSKGNLWNSDRLPKVVFFPLWSAQSQVVLTYGYCVNVTYTSKAGHGLEISLKRFTVILDPVEL